MLQIRFHYSTFVFCFIEGAAANSNYQYELILLLSISYQLSYSLPIFLFFGLGSSKVGSTFPYNSLWCASVYLTIIAYSTSKYLYFF